MFTVLEVLALSVLAVLPLAEATFWHLYPEAATPATPTDHFNQTDFTGTNLWFANLSIVDSIEHKGLPAQFRVHNFNKESGADYTTTEKVDMLEEIGQTSCLGRLKKDLFSASADANLQRHPDLIDLNDYDVQGKFFGGVEATWYTSTNVVYSWQFSNTWGAFKTLYEHIKDDESYPTSLKYKIRTLIERNNGILGNGTIFHFKYIGETTRTAWIRQGEHDTDDAHGGSAVLSGMFRAVKELKWTKDKITPQLLFVAQENKNYPLHAQKMIKFAEATFATLCGEGTMNGTCAEMCGLFCSFVF